MTTVELIAQYIARHLTPKRPYFVALQGPQGSGKSYTTAALAKFLQAPPHSLRVVSLSIDDLYLPHEGLVRLAQSNPDNILWQGRGQPGTHDVDLGVHILNELKNAHSSIELPRFDKSLYSGQGDRLPMDGTGTTIKQPPVADVVILEGWCVGFRSISDEELLSRWNSIWQLEREKLSIQEERTCQLTDIMSVNEKLKGYDRLWDFFDCLVQLRSEPPPSPIESEYAIVYKWRLQQEHHMKATNGGRGMTDEEVKSFVDRYIPGYVFFGDIVSKNSGNTPQRAKNGIVLTLDEKRVVTRTYTNGA